VGDVADHHSFAPLLLTKETLFQSVIHEVSALLNTRTSFTAADLQELRDKVPHEKWLAGIPGLMGLPSSDNIFMEGGNAWVIFQDLCTLMLRLFEPRLEAPEVKIEKFDTNQRLHMTISGILKKEGLRERVSFSVEGLIPSEDVDAGLSRP
jgi:predicted component of type VI protein secretion system